MKKTYIQVQNFIIGRVTIKMNDLINKLKNEEDNVIKLKIIKDLYECASVIEQATKNKEQLENEVEEYKEKITNGVEENGEKN